MKKYLKQLPVALLMSLTLGLAPFYPESHIWGKVKWILGGAQGMRAVDWFDALMHGAPWVYLLFIVTNIILIKLKPDAT